MRKKNNGWNTECIDNTYFSEQNLKKHPERFVIVGFIAADGCISQPIGQPQLIFSLSAKDRIALDIINKEIAKGERTINEFYTKCQNGKQYPTVRLTIPSWQICYDLARYGIVPRKTETLPFPHLSEPAMSYFLRGYFYGDGCVYGEEGRSRYQFIGSTIFISAFKEYLIWRGIVERVALYLVKRNPLFANLEITGRQANMMAEYMFSNDKMVLLPRKHIKIDIPIFSTHWSKEETQELIACKSYTEIKQLCKKIGRPYDTGKVKRLQLTEQILPREKRIVLPWTDEHREIHRLAMAKAPPKLKNPKTGRFIAHSV